MRIHLILLLTGGVVTGTSSLAQELLTLDQAIQLASADNRLVSIAKLGVEIANSQVEASRTRRYPILNVGFFGGTLLRNADFSFPVGSFGDFPTTGPIPPLDTIIRTPPGPFGFLIASVTQPLSQLHKIALGVHLQELDRDLAAQKLRAQQRDVVGEVKGIYFDLVQQQSALKATRESIDFLAELERVAAASLQEQALLKKDLLEVQSRLAEARFHEIQIENGSRIQKRNLNRILGRALDLDFSVQESPDSFAPLPDLQVAQHLALTQRAEVREAEIWLLQAEYDRRFKKAEFVPEISLNLAYLSPYNVEVVPRNVLVAGVTLTWDVFDWGRKRHELENKNRVIEQARLGLDEARAQVLTEVEYQHNRVREIQALLEVKRLAREVSLEALRVVTDQQDQQMALVKDTLEKGAAVARARFDYQQTLASYWTARADFEKAVGGM